MRSQQHKSSATRDQILKATIESLVEVGLVATTFERVSHIASQSRGAITYHFPSRNVLLLETLRDIQRQRIAAYREAMANEVRSFSGFERSVEIYWDTFCDPLYVAYQELVWHARIDRNLATSLIPLHREFESEWDRVVLGVHMDWPNSVELFRRTRTIATFLMEGMARERLIFEADDSWLHSIRQDLKAWMRHMMVTEQGKT